MGGGGLVVLPYSRNCCNPQGLALGGSEDERFIAVIQGNHRRQQGTGSWQIVFGKCWCDQAHGLRTSQF